MIPTHSRATRRQFLAVTGATAGLAALAASARWFDRGAFAEELDGRVLSPGMTEGPFYPDRLPLEIWQVDNTGSYIHSRGGNRQTGGRDGNFQGYGRFLTGSTGEYYFRTIKPVPYPGRTPHIHVKVHARGEERLTTQFFVKDHAMNARDGVLRGVRSPAAQALVMSDYTPLPDSKIGELVANYDVVLGLTLEA